MKITMNSKIIPTSDSKKVTTSVPLKRKVLDVDDALESGSVGSGQAKNNVASSDNPLGSPLALSSRHTYLMLDSKKAISVDRDAVVDLLAKKTLTEMLEHQKDLGVPFVLAQCQCAIHFNRSVADAKLGSTHPQFLEGSLVYEKFDSDVFLTSKIGQLEVSEMKVLDGFSRNNFMFYLVNPFDKRAVPLATKSLMLQDIRDNRVAFLGAYALNETDPKDSENAMGTMFTAAMFHAGIRVNKDSDYARSIFLRFRSEHGNSLDAEVLTMAIVDNQFEMLKSLLELGVDSDVEREEGGTVLSYAHRVGSKEAIRILEDHSTVI